MKKHDKKRNVMRTIVIDEELETSDDFIYVLEHIAGQIREGYTSGIEPSWTLEGEDEDVSD